LRPDGVLDLLADDLSRPNGIAFAPDERTLYVSDTHGVIIAYDVRGDGTLGRRRVFHAVRGDGVKVDRRGRVYVATSEGVSIFSDEGHLIGTIVTDEAPANLAWGEDGSVLYITATKSLYRVPLAVTGVRPASVGGR
jgi:gluconolactonase